MASLRLISGKIVKSGIDIESKPPNETFREFFMTLLKDDDYSGKTLNFIHNGIDISKSCAKIDWDSVIDIEICRFPRVEFHIVCGKEVYAVHEKIPAEPDFTLNDLFNKFIATTQSRKLAYVMRDSLTNDPRSESLYEISGSKVKVINPRVPLHLSENAHVMFDRGYVYFMISDKVSDYDDKLEFVSTPFDESNSHFTEWTGQREYDIQLRMAHACNYMGM
jgi:hypothetical protein